MRRTLVTLHRDTFTVDPKPSDHMELHLSNNILQSIAWELESLVFVEGGYDSGDTFFLPSQEWTNAAGVVISVPETTWTVGTMPNGYLEIVEATRRPSMWHVLKTGTDYHSWTIINAMNGQVISLDLDWLTEWDGFYPTIGWMLPLHPCDIIFFHPFVCHHPEIPGINRLRRYTFLPVWTQIEPLTKADEWNPDLD